MFAPADAVWFTSTLSANETGPRDTKEDSPRRPPVESNANRLLIADPQTRRQLKAAVLDDSVDPSTLSQVLVDSRLLPPASRDLQCKMVNQLIDSYETHLLRADQASAAECEHVAIEKQLQVEHLKMLHDEKLTQEKRAVEAQLRLEAAEQQLKEEQRKTQQAQVHVTNEMESSKKRMSGETSPLFRPTAAPDSPSSPKQRNKHQNQSSKAKQEKSKKTKKGDKLPAGTSKAASAQKSKAKKQNNFVDHKADVTANASWHSKLFQKIFIISTGLNETRVQRQYRLFMLVFVLFGLFFHLVVPAWLSEGDSQRAQVNIQMQSRIRRERAAHGPVPLRVRESSAVDRHNQLLREMGLAGSLVRVEARPTVSSPQLSPGSNGLALYAVPGQRLRPGDIAMQIQWDAMLCPRDFEVCATEGPQSTELKLRSWPEMMLLMYLASTRGNRSSIPMHRMFMESLPSSQLRHLHPVTASSYQQGILTGSFTATQMGCLQEAIRTDFIATKAALLEPAIGASSNRRCSELRRKARDTTLEDVHWALVAYGTRGVPVRHMEPRQQCMVPGFDIVAEAPNAANLVRMEFSDAMDFVVDEAISNGLGPNDELAIDRHEIDTYYKQAAIFKFGYSVSTPPENAHDVGPVALILNDTIAARAFHGTLRRQSRDGTLDQLACPNQRLTFMAEASDPGIQTLSLSPNSKAWVLWLEKIAEYQPWGLLKKGLAKLALSQAVALIARAHRIPIKETYSMLCGAIKASLTARKASLSKCQRTAGNAARKCHLQGRAQPACVGAMESVAECITAEANAWGPRINGSIQQNGTTQVVPTR